MKVLKRSRLWNFDGLVSSNAPQSGPTWNLSGFYLFADVVVYQYYKYRSLQMDNTGHNPTSSPEWWVNIGPNNPLAMLDDSVETQTFIDFVPLVFTLDTSECDSLFLGNITGTEVKVEVLTVGGASVVETHDFNLADSAITDWYEFFFWDPENIATQLFLTGLPRIFQGQMRVTVQPDSAKAAVGIASFGSSVDMGSTSVGVSSGIIDYSRKETDEFGNTVIVKRGYSRKVNAETLIPNARLNVVQKLLYDLRATPCTWVVDDSPQFSEPLVLYGIYREFETTLIENNWSTLSIELESLK